MNRRMIAPLAGCLTAVGITLALPAEAHADPFDQRSFPCQEDEVLGFDPAFGPDRVGCIHIERLVGRELDRIESQGGERW